MPSVDGWRPSSQKGPRIPDSAAAFSVNRCRPPRRSRAPRRTPRFPRRRSQRSVDDRVVGMKRVERRGNPCGPDAQTMTEPHKNAQAADDHAQDGRYAQAPHDPATGQERDGAEYIERYRGIEIERGAAKSFVDIDQPSWIKLTAQELLRKMSRPQDVYEEIMPAGSPIVEKGEEPDYGQDDAVKGRMNPASFLFPPSCQIHDLGLCF